MGEPKMPSAEEIKKSIQEGQIKESVSDTDKYQELLNTVKNYESDKAAAGDAKRQLLSLSSSSIENQIEIAKQIEEFERTNEVGPTTLEILKAAETEGYASTNYWRNAPSDRETGLQAPTPFEVPSGYAWVEDKENSDYWGLEKSK